MEEFDKNKGKQWIIVSLNDLNIGRMKQENKDPWKSKGWFESILPSFWCGGAGDSDYDDSSDGFDMD